MTYINKFLHKMKEVRPLVFILVMMIFVIMIFVINKYTFPCYNENFIVSVLSILVTVLVGFQIYNAIDINNKINNLENIARKEVLDQLNIYDHKIKARLITIDTKDLYNRNITGAAIDGYLRAINEAIKGKGWEEVKEIVIVLRKIISQYDGLNLILSQENKNKYLEILKKIQNQDVSDIIYFIDNAKIDDKNYNGIQLT